MVCCLACEWAYTSQCHSCTKQCVRLLSGTPRWDWAVCSAAGGDTQVGLGSGPHWHHTVRAARCTLTDHKPCSNSCTTKHLTKLVRCNLWESEPQISATCVCPVEVAGDPVHSQTVRGRQLLLYDRLQVTAIQTRTSGTQNNHGINIKKQTKDDK